MSVHLLSWLSDTHPGFRLMPMRARLRSGLESLPGFLPYPVGPVLVSNEVDGKLTLTLQRPLAEDLGNAAGSIHDFLLGILKETVASLGGGRSFQVDQVSESASGQGAWVFCVDLEPVE
jgi:hypothetical protein